MQTKPFYNRMKEATIVCIKSVIMLLFWAAFFLILTIPAKAETLTASWYSEASLKKEGTWKTSKGIMANGKKFDETKLTCATRKYPLGSKLHVTNHSTGLSVTVIVTDRIGKRFANTRIDLSKAAFKKIASLDKGLVKVEVR